MPAAVIFDLDGVLIDSESLWDDARRQLVEESGGVWKDEAQQAMMGMSSSEWSHYMHEELGVPMSSEESVPAEELSADEAAAADSDRAPVPDTKSSARVPKDI